MSESVYLTHTAFMNLSPQQEFCSSLFCYTFIEELQTWDKVHKSEMGSSIILHIYVERSQRPKNLSFPFSAKTQAELTTVLTSITIYYFCLFFNLICVESYSVFSFKALASLLNVTSVSISQLIALVIVHFCCIAFHYIYTP